MTSPRRPRRTQDGQALIEFGMVIFAVIALTLLAIGVSILSAARAEVDGAVQMAALGAASVPAQSPTDGYAAADAAWRGTAGRDSFLILQPLPRSCAGVNPNGGYTPGDVISCTGTAQLNLSGSILAIIWPFPNPTISATTRIRTSGYRST